MLRTSLREHRSGLLRTSLGRGGMRLHRHSARWPRAFTCGTIRRVCLLWRVSSSSLLLRCLMGAYHLVNLPPADSKAGSVEMVV